MIDPNTQTSEKIDFEDCLRIGTSLRRGKALLSLDLPDKALGEFEAAAKILPDDQTIGQDVENLKDHLQQMESNSSSSEDDDHDQS